MGSAPACSECTYNAAGRMRKVGRENGRVVHYTYAAADRLTDETWFDADSPAIYAFEWDYDCVGNRTYQKRGADQTHYEHNGANELTK